MSTPDTLLIPDITVLPEPLREPVRGISFGSYLFVEAAHLDELPTRTVLAWLGVCESGFEFAENVWNDRLTEELERDEGSFDEFYANLLAKASSFWNRPIAPLDTDIQCWICFQRHLLETPDLARKLGLTAGDEIRLEWLWRIRLSDPTIAAMAIDACSSPLSPLPKITIAALSFPLRADGT